MLFNTLSSAGEALIKTFETLALAAYQDPGGVWTLGYGHTVGVKEGDTCTPEQAEDWFQHETNVIVGDLDAHLLTNCTQNQFDALVSFTYNVGWDAEEHSTMMRLLNQRRFLDASAEFPKWNHIDGEVSAGLTRRRAAEQALFDGLPWQHI